MNKVYQLIYNEQTDSWVAVAENVRAKSKSKNIFAVAFGAIATGVVGMAVNMSIAFMPQQTAMAACTSFTMNTAQTRVLIQ